VGRVVELRVLHEAWEAAAAGNGGVIFVVGEAGIGKSRLAQAVMADADARGAPVLRGRAVRTATPSAYRALAEAVYSASRSRDVLAMSELAPFRRVLGRLLPHWQSADSLQSVESVVALAEALRRLFGALATPDGCVVMLEDLHWADPETLAIVDYLADNLSSERVLCIATLRNEEPSPGLTLAHVAQARRSSELVELRRLEQPDIALMLKSCLDASALPDELLAFAARADGVPFLIEELLTVAVASGALLKRGQSWALSGSVDLLVPSTFAETVRARLAALGAEARWVVAAAAVLGRRFDWAILPTITGLPEASVTVALRAAFDAHLIAVDGAGPAFRFRHALSRDAVLATLLPPERSGLSRRALQALEEHQGGLEGQERELAAELAEAAGDRRRAAQLLLEVGSSASEAGALSSAEAALERALTLAPPGDPLIAHAEERLVEVLSQAGRHDRAVEVGDLLLGRLSGDEHAGQRAQIHVWLAGSAVGVSRWQEALVHLDQARVAAAEEADGRLFARADSLEALAALGADDQDRAAGLARVALAAAENLDLPEVACEALEVLGRCERWRDVAAAEEAFRRAHGVAEAHGLRGPGLRALHELGTIDLLRAGDTKRLEQARELAAQVGAMTTVADLDVQICAGQLNQDDPETALLTAYRAIESARRYGLRPTLAVALGFAATAHARAKRRNEMEACLREARAQDVVTADMEIVEVGARVSLALAEDDPAGGLRYLDGSAQARYSAPYGGLWALLRAALGADESAVEEIHIRGEPVYFSGRAYLRYAEAVVAGRAGQHAAAATAALAGDRLLAPFGWFRHYAHRLIARAAFDADWGDPAAWLHEAQPFFEAIGDHKIASTCRSLLRQAGVPVRRRGRGTSDVPPKLRALGLTSREVDVLALVAGALSNREIAQQLFLSPRTVEAHVARLLTKTGTSNRRDLRDLAVRLGLKGTS
jgi:DNA-binding CsgD family transcriptional regulator